MSNFKNYISELLGTALLVFIGTGSVALTELVVFTNPQLIIGFGFGIAVLLPILLFGKISGAHLNPAVSIVMFLKKEIIISTLLFYIIAQCLGAILGSYIVKLSFQTSNIGLTFPSGSYQQSFIIEFILTFFLVFVILYSTSKLNLKKYAPYFIAFTVALEAYFGGPISGASMNPARSLGPAFASMNFTSIEIYLLAPIIGGAFALLIFNKAVNVK